MGHIPSHILCANIFFAFVLDRPGLQKFSNQREVQEQFHI